MFSSGEELSLFSDSATTRFTASAYLRGDGCMDFGFSRDQEPWEATDGAVFMVAELAGVRPQAAAEHLPQLAEVVGRANGFGVACKLRESLWRMLPRISTGIGKQLLKRHLEPFLAPLFQDLSCGAALTELAAGEAVGALRDALGAKILASRLTDAQAMALHSNDLIPPQSSRLGLRA